MQLQPAGQMYGGGNIPTPILIENGDQQGLIFTVLLHR